VQALGKLGKRSILPGLRGALAILFVATAGCEARPQLAHPAREVSSNLIPLGEAEGQRLLFESEARAPFVPLVSHFETQARVTLCGPTTLAMVLNALEAPAPAPRAYAPHRLFTQENVLNAMTRDVVSESAVARGGMSLRQAGEVLRVYGLDVETHYAGGSSMEAFRVQAMAYLSREDHHVIVNYDRAALDQSGAGHISPLAAYDAESDRFLILDVSRYKAPPVWVRTHDLFAAMAAPVSSGRTRGFLLVRKAANAAP
jgi:hypothetical protein